jgi:2-oxoisovalerate dehydrogenase E1 component
MVEAIGSSPSDESITVVEWHIEPGSEIESGQVVADLEADKAAVELRSPVGGTAEELLAEEGDMVKVGAPLIKVNTGTDGEEDSESLKPVTREEPGTPIISGLDAAALATRRSSQPAAAAAGAVERGTQVGLVGVTSAKGSRVVSNEEIAEMCPHWSPEDIVKRTGIESRPWLAEGETGVSLGVRAVKELFERTGLTLEDIDVMICATETPLHNTPSMATLIQSELKTAGDGFYAQAYDINAACTGYLYAMQHAYDYLQSEPESRVLIVTAEALSPRLDTSDPNTAPIFGDAATASLVVGAPNMDGSAARVYRPVLGANGEDGTLLKVPASTTEPIFMDGPRVFVEAVKDMIAGLKDACDVAGVDPDGLSLVVPHQANQRIINAVRQRMKAPKERMYSNIRHNGNTSSCTIPLCLEEIFADSPESGSHIGLTAFGGGFTYGGGVIRLA